MTQKWYPKNYIFLTFGVLSLSTVLPACQLASQTSQPLSPASSPVSSPSPSATGDAESAKASSELAKTVKDEVKQSKNDSGDSSNSPGSSSKPPTPEESKAKIFEDFLENNLSSDSKRFHNYVGIARAQEQGQKFCEKLKSGATIEPSPSNKRLDNWGRLEAATRPMESALSDIYFNELPENERFGEKSLSYNSTVVEYKSAMIVASVSTTCPEQKELVMNAHGWDLLGDLNWTSPK